MILQEVIENSQKISKKQWEITTENSKFVFISTIHMDGQETFYMYQYYLPFSDTQSVDTVRLAPHYENQTWSTEEINHYMNYHADLLPDNIKDILAQIYVANYGV